MALGKNGQFFYSPDVSAYIVSSTLSPSDPSQPQTTIDVSEDIMKIDISRVLNGVSSASLLLSNFNYKYIPSTTFTPANSASDKTVIPQPIINTMDQIVISLKRTSYYQVFTGFITYAPIIALVPSPIEIKASCTLYKAQNSWWDSGAVDLQYLIPSMLFAEKDETESFLDGGAGQGMINILADVCNWPVQNIRIAPLPINWLYQSAFVAGVNGSQNTSSSPTQNNSQTLYSATQLSNIKVKRHVNGAPVGTDLPSPTIKAQYLTDSGILNTAGLIPVVDPKYFNTINTPLYWIVSPMSCAGSINNSDSNSIDKLTPKQWLQGGNGKGAQPYKTSFLNKGRLVQLSNPTNGATIWAHLIGIEGLYSGGTTYISDTAYTFLNGGTGPSQSTQQEAAPAISLNVDGYVDPTGETITLADGPIKNPASLQGSTSSTNSGSTSNTGSGASKVSLVGVLGPDQIVQVFENELGIKQANMANINNYQWAYVLLRTLGVKASDLPSPANLVKNPTNNILSVVLWGNHEACWWFYEPPAGSTNKYPTFSHSYNDPLNTGNGPHFEFPPNNPYNNRFSFQSVEVGIYWTAMTLLTGGDGHETDATIPYGDYKTVCSTLQSNGSVTSFITALQPTKWGAADKNHEWTYGATVQQVEAVLTNRNVYTNQGVNAGTQTGYNYADISQSASASTINFSTILQPPSFTQTGTLLEGKPDAFVAAEPALATISTLATAGLRVFQSAPNGDFISWFPDYFGLYGTAPSMDIYDIEIIDLKIYHDDTQLVTHVGVAGDINGGGTNGIGTAVTLADWLNTAAIMSITGQTTESADAFGMIRTLFGINPADTTGKLGAKFGFNGGNSAADQLAVTAFMNRYGMRPFVEEVPLIKSAALQNFYAIQTFYYLWSTQYNTQARFTFLPELYPGMIIKLPEHNLQFFVQAVTHSGSRDGGFSTDAVLTCPSLIDPTGKNQPVPMHYGYPTKTL